MLNAIIGLLLQWKWWDRSIDEIDALIPILTNSNLEEVKEEVRRQNNER